MQSLPLARVAIWWYIVLGASTNNAFRYDAKPTYTDDTGPVVSAAHTRKVYFA